MILVDPLAAAVKAVFLWRDEKERQQWIVLLLSIALSDFVTFFSVCGSALVAHSALLVSVGSGMVAVAAVTLTLLLRDPLAKKLFLAVPRPVAEKALDDPSLALIPPAK